ncbi:MAG: carbohydrate ABC transporter substrate-binding protein, partial [Oscillospiraceae bacterium]|nr:carbohydrate ABC transporter substrate-binding protein [Oscillospiraceae bacterium]
MKKILALILALCMVFAIAACGEKTDGKTDGQTDGKTDGNNTEATGSVYWLSFKPESDADLQKLAAMYTET